MPLLKPSLRRFPTLCALRVDGCNSNQNIQNTPQLRDCEFRLFGRSVGRCCWCLVCIAHTYRLSVNKQLASRTDVFFSSFRQRWRILFYRRRVVGIFRTLFLFVYSREHRSEHQHSWRSWLWFLPVFPHEDLTLTFLNRIVANWFQWTVSVLLVCMPKM